MDQEVMKKETVNYTIDLLITMVVDELANDFSRDEKDVLEDFLISQTGKSLYDETTKLWCNGPSYIADIYKREMEKNGAV